MNYRKVLALLIISSFALLGYGFFSIEPLEIPYFLNDLSRSNPASDCGPKSLQLVLSHYGIEASVDELKQRAGTTAEGTSLLALRNTARSFGLSADGWMVAREDLHELTLPAIVFIHGKHFSVLTSSTAESVVLIDPDQGAVRIPLEDFFDIWEGHTLIFTPVGRPVLPLLSPQKGTTETVTSKGGST